MPSMSIWVQGRTVASISNLRFYGHIAELGSINALPEIVGGAVDQHGGGGCGRDALQDVATCRKSHTGEFLEAASALRLSHTSSAPNVVC
jgi:hypothetical protein